MTSILDVIGHYQRSIEKSAHDEARLLHCIEKLYKLPITVEHLQQTGIGKTVNALRKYDKEVGVAAKALVAKWKAMVAAEEELADDEETHKTNDHPSNSDSDNYNGSQYSQENQNGRYNRQNPQSSSRSDINPEGREKKHKETRKDESRSRSRSSTADMIKAHNVLHDRHSNDKIISASSSKHNKENPNDMQHYQNPEHSDIRKDGKLKISTEHSNRKVQTPEHVDESPPQASDDNLYETDDEDDDEDDEKLVIDTEHSKEKLEDVAKPSSRESAKPSKSHHKTSSKRNSNEEDDKESDYHSRKRQKTADKQKDKDLKDSKIASTSKSQNGEKFEHNKSEERHHKSDKKEADKPSDRHNGKHKSNSSSKSKNRDKSKDNNTDRQSTSKNETETSTKESGRSNSKKSSKRKHHSPESSESDSEKSSPKKVKSTRNAAAEGIDNSMGNLSFEEALGMMAPPAKSAAPKLKSPKANGTPSTYSSSSVSTSRASTSSSSSSSSVIPSKTPSLLTSKVKLEPLDLKLSLELPTISPNYKPMPLNPAVMDCVFPNNLNKVPAPPPRRLMTDDEALQSGIQSKTMRTKIYSGIKSGAMFQVPTLFQLCIRVLQKNIDALEYTGGVPFGVLKTVLELASPEQLQTFEEFNPYLLEDTDELWRVHCGRRYKTKKREEYESWREMFARCKEEDEVRLSLLTKNISFQQKQIAAPIKRTQLAYVDVDVKPPRNIQRKQEQYGTKGKMIATPAARVESLSKINPSVAKIGDTRLRTAADMRDYAQASSHIRPKKAPLMQKTLQLMKGRFKR